jgi:hypothetical protein
MLKIKLRVSNSFTKAQCVLCRQVFERGGIDALLYEDNEIIGNICELCMEEGSKNFSSLLRAHAQRVREWAGELEKMVHEGVAFRII